MARWSRQASRCGACLPPGRNAVACPGDGRGCRSLRLSRPGSPARRALARLSATAVPLLLGARVARRLWISSSPHALLVSGDDCELYVPLYASHPWLDPLWAAATLQARAAAVVRGADLERLVLSWARILPAAAKPR